MVKKGLFQERILYHLALFSQPRQYPQRSLCPRSWCGEQLHRVSPISKVSPMVLQASGYDTAYVGKWHMGEEMTNHALASTVCYPPWTRQILRHRIQLQTVPNVKSCKGYYTTAVTDMAAEWIERPRDGKPWCLMIRHKAPHSFYFPEPKYEKAFENVRVAYPETAFMLDDNLNGLGNVQHLARHYGPLFDWRKKFPRRFARSRQRFRGNDQSLLGHSA